MSKPTKKLSTITAFVEVKLSLGVRLKANTLEDGIVEAKTLKPHDILDMNGLEYNDGDLKVTGVYSD